MDKIKYLQYTVGNVLSLYGPRRGKTCLQGFQQSETQTSHSLVASLNMIFSNKRIIKALTDCVDLQADLRHCCCPPPLKTGFLAPKAHILLEMCCHYVVSLSLAGKCVFLKLVDNCLSVQHNTY